jgi:quinol monooxygenase YgiN
MPRVLAAVLALALGAPAVADDNPIVASIKSKLKDPAQPFTLLVTVKVKDGAGEKLEAAFKPAAAATRKEAGNLVYQMSRDTDHPDTYVLYERWKNLDALKEHMDTDYLKKLLAGLGEMAAGPPEIKVLTPVGE